ncbi:hypothetical protein [Enterobacter cloacae]|uniref:hypothetical protein n=1 Tax=Enterobacter cloacae TaxID=550 RepID=UPI001F34A751|nr:hypothetical protein [Enterobacter cloacae]
MSTITKEWLQQAINDYESVRDELPFGLDDYQEKILASLRIALASLEAEPVACMGNGALYHSEEEARADSRYILQPLYTSPPAPVSVPECFKRLLHHAYGMTMGHDWNKGTMAGHHRTKLCQAVEECRAAMLQGAESVTTAYKLPDDFDFDRFNDVVWLEAVASNPHMHSLTTSTIAMVALELNKRLNVANSPVIPDGWVMVPVEPTMEMLDEFDSIIDHGAEDSKEAWSRLIAAAPQQEVKS